MSAGAWLRRLPTPAQISAGYRTRLDAEYRSCAPGSLNIVLNILLVKQLSRCIQVLHSHCDGRVVGQVVLNGHFT